MSERSRGRLSHWGGWNTVQVEHLLTIYTVPDQTAKSKSNKVLVFFLKLSLGGVVVVRVRDRTVATEMSAGADSTDVPGIES